MGALWDNFGAIRGDSGVFNGFQHGHQNLHPTAYDTFPAVEVRGTAEPGDTHARAFHSYSFHFNFWRGECLRRITRHGPGALTRVSLHGGQGESMVLPYTRGSVSLSELNFGTFEWFQVRVSRTKRLKMS